MQGAADTLAAVSEVAQGTAMGEEAALRAAAAEKLHTSPAAAFDFESLLHGLSQLPDPVHRSTAPQPPHIRLEAPAAMPGQDALGESSLLHHLSSLQVRGLPSMWNPS